MNPIGYDSLDAYVEAAVREAKRDARYGAIREACSAMCYGCEQGISCVKAKGGQWIHVDVNGNLYTVCAATNIRNMRKKNPEEESQ